ncbi:MAG: 50S ribosomal protein L11 methyltransferase [Gemmatimonadetes bacterium]|nr:50S ribosomal protein L11 methyltransferase [Gemmatimonadota bacterium]
MSRRWLQMRVRPRADPDLSPLLVEGLLAVGARAAEERDGWIVTAVEEPADLEEFVEGAKTTLRDLSGSDDFELEVEWRSHEDWAETWKRGLAPRRITERILVRPSWIPAPPDAPPIDIVVDPGMAFGTAEHGTTRGCLRLLDEAVQAGDRVLDVGSGSGILAIAASRLGASSVVAIEADALACEALRENLEHNAVQERVRCVEAMVGPDDLAALGPVDGVVANIESRPLLGLMEGFVRALAPGGWLILSGILDHEWPSVREAAERAGLLMRRVDEDGEWRSGLFTRGR